MKHKDPLKRNPLVDKFADKEVKDINKQFNSREDGKTRLYHTLDSLVEQEITFPKKSKVDRYSHIKDFLKKK